jgi:single-strand DNA-binding protein|tara:strand:- start:936 stop:1310 length:375 start_codon:yes stop_codon:yes gene_type:complete
MVNKVMLIGRMGVDPEINVGQSGPRARLSLAMNSMVNGEEKTTWVWVTAFGKTAESLAKHGEKGRQIFVEGRLDTYGEDNRLSVTVFRVQYLSPKKQSAAPATGGGNYGNYYQQGGDNDAASPF